MKSAILYLSRNNESATALFVALAVYLSAGPALAQKAQAAPPAGKVSLTLLTGSQSQEMTVDGFDFLKGMSEAADALQTYSFRSHMTVFKNDKTIEENSQFYFKKPRKLRADELGPHKKGSVAVLMPGGKVKGHMGGLLSKFSGTVDAGSEWVRSANGYPLSDSDFYGMAQVMLKFAREGKKTLVTEAPVNVTGQAKPVYVLEMYTNAARVELMKRAYIDPQTLLPVEWFDYKDGKLFAHTTWKDVKLNVDLSDSLFVL
jgi:outer membrane lipoprotein-sorting protein